MSDHTNGTQDHFVRNYTTILCLMTFFIIFLIVGLYEQAIWNDNDAKKTIDKMTCQQIKDAMANRSLLPYVADEATYQYKWRCP